MAFIIILQVSCVVLTSLGILTIYLNDAATGPALVAAGALFFAISEKWSKMRLRRRYNEPKYGIEKWKLRWLNRMK